MNGSSPTQEGNGANWVYAYTLPCNSSLSDTLHVELTIFNTNTTTPESYTIGFSQAGSSPVVATLPASFSLTDNGVTVTKDIPIAANNLAPGNYELNINIDTPPSDLTESNAKKIHVMIQVNECAASAPTCFFTDSNGEFLADCSGDLVSTNEGGKFMLVNKKNGVIVSTNPGQFYYNYIWSNDGAAGSAVWTSTSGTLTNLVPQGANAVHAYTFDTSGFTQNLDAFEIVNHDGTPCGPSGPCTINVGKGQTLWVTWHLAYSGIGLPKPGATYLCETADEVIGAVANTNIAGACSTSAKGYNSRCSGPGRRVRRGNRRRLPWPDRSPSDRPRRPLPAVSLPR